MKQHYHLLILGATALGIAAANANRSLRTAVIETGCTCAPEFAAALKTDGQTSGYIPSTDAAAFLRDEMTKRGALGDGGEWLPALSPVIAARLKASGADCYFMSAINDITTDGERYEVSFVCYGVVYRFTADYILDTTSRFVSRAWLSPDGSPAPVMAERSLCYLDDERKIRRFPACGDIAETRLALLEQADSEHKITFPATELCITPAESVRKLGGQACWMPSAAYPNFLAAYDAGAGFHPKKDGEPFIDTPTILTWGDYDVIVVGLGTAGMMAALTAASEGLRVLGLENLSMAGGSTSAGGILGYYYGFKGGRYQELDKYAKRFDEKLLSSGNVGPTQKTAAFDALAKGRLECRYGAFFTGTIQCGQTVSGVCWTENGNVCEASAKFVIDCTAEASVCVAAGCTMQGGRQSDGRFQPYSSVFYKLAGKSVGWGYCDNGAVNPYDADDFGNAVLTSAVSYIHLRDSYAAHDYLGIAPLIGLREGRKILGEENVSFEELIAGKYTAKPIYFGQSNLDNHGKDSALEDRIYQDWITIAGMWGWGVAIPMPMGALIPKGTRGLLAAGRNVAVEHNLSMGLRMKDDCHKSGEAAGMLAALAVRDGVDAKEVDVDELRGRLFATGCIRESDRMLLERQTFNEFHTDKLWCDDDGALAEGLAGDEPGWYIWSAKALGKRGLLHQLLESDKPLLHRNAALALALLDDDAGVDVLLELAASRDGYIPKTGRKYVTLHAISAISALGRLGAAEAVPLLCGMLADESYLTEIPLTPYELIYDRDDLRFHYETTIIAALCEIAAAHPALRDELGVRLRGFVQRREFLISMMFTHGLKFDATASVRAMVERV